MQYQRREILLVATGLSTDRVIRSGAAQGLKLPGIPGSTKREMSHREMIHVVCRTSPDLGYNTSGIEGDSRDRDGNRYFSFRDIGRHSGLSSFLSRGGFFSRKRPGEAASKIKSPKREDNQSRVWTTRPERSFGSNQVDLGGMMPPASAISITVSTFTGCIEKATAYPSFFTMFSRSPIGRAPPR